MNKEYIYIFVRKDLTPEQRAVQACHAAAESGILFVNKYDEAHPHTMILIGVRDLKELNEAFSYTLSNNIRACMFFEPDAGECGEDTAFATQPILEEQRAVFEQYRLLKYERGILYHLKVFIRSIKRELFD